MKTIKGLRRAIEQNGGTLKIGWLEFSVDRTGDIKVTLSGKGVAWINTEGGAGTKLKNVDMAVSRELCLNSEHAHIQDLLEENRSLKAENSGLRGRINKLTEQAEQLSKDAHFGKAMKELLENRDITLKKGE